MPSKADRGAHAAHGAKTDQEKHAAEDTPDQAQRRVNAGEPPQDAPDPSPGAGPVEAETHRSDDPTIGEGTRPGDRNEYPSGAADDQAGMVPPSGDQISEEDKARDHAKLRVDQDDPSAAIQEPFVDYVSNGDEQGGGAENVQATKVTQDCYVTMRDGTEVEAKQGQYLVRNGDGDIRVVDSGEFQSNFGKPDADQADTEHDTHPAVGVLVFAIQRITERPGDGDNVGAIYARADEAGINLRELEDAGRAEKA